MPLALVLALLAAAGGVLLARRRSGPTRDLAAARALMPYVRQHVSTRLGLADPGVVRAFRASVGLPAEGGWDGRAAGALLALDPTLPVVPPLPLGRTPPTPVVPYTLTP